MSGTDRVAEVIDRISEAKIIINIQADEPLIDPKIIDSLVDSFKDNNIQMSTAVSTRLTVSDLLNPNIVKALIDQDKNAIEFKRNIFDVEIGGVYRHIGIYGFTNQALMRYVNFKRSKLEIERNLEQIINIAKSKNINIILAGMKASPTNGLAYKKKFDDIFPKLAEEYDLTLIPFLLKKVALNPKFNQSDGIHPNYEGAKVISETIKESIINFD